VDGEVLARSLHRIKAAVYDRSADKGATFNSAV